MFGLKEKGIKYNSDNSLSPKKNKYKLYEIIKTIKKEGNSASKKKDIAVIIKKTTNKYLFCLFDKTNLYCSF